MTVLGATQLASFLERAHEIAQIAAGFDAILSNDDPVKVLSYIDDVLATGNSVLTQSNSLAGFFGGQPSGIVPDVIAITASLSTFLQNIQEYHNLYAAFDDGNLTQLSRNFLDDALAFTAIETTSLRVSVLINVTSAFDYIAGSAAVVNYIDSAQQTLASVWNQSQITSWLLEVERFEELGETIAVISDYQVLLGAALDEADRLVGGNWGADTVSVGPNLEAGSSFSDAQTETNASDTAGSMSVVNLGEFVGILSDGAGNQRAVLDYSDANPPQRPILKRPILISFFTLMIRIPIMSGLAGH